MDAAEAGEEDQPGSGFPDPAGIEDAPGRAKSVPRGAWRVRATPVEAARLQGRRTLVRAAGAHWRESRPQSNQHRSHRLAERKRRALAVARDAACARRQGERESI